MSSPEVYQNKQTFNDDPDAFISQYRFGPNRYLRIYKKSGWKKNICFSLKTKNKEEAIKRAKIKYQELIGTNQFLENCLFNDEDLKIATLRKGLGRICEDKFKNLMMVKGYQVSKPVEDIWGYDFLISKDGKSFNKVQVKSTSQSGKMNFHLVTNHSAAKLYYKQIVDYMAFISILDDTVWLVPVKELPDKTAITLTELKNQYKNFIVGY